ncbi:MAG TPA: phosphoglycerate dehydrogenase [Elusimicrobia bacterium]|nr:phosphoglycerate dehydrogenase [Elusimicrobiota bacterium]
MRVLVSDPISAEGLMELKKYPQFKVDFKLKLKPEELISLIPEYEVLLVRSETKVTKEIINGAKKLKLIGRAGTGVDNIDVNAATKAGILVMNVPGGNTIAATEHTFALLLAIARNLARGDVSTKQGKWERSKFVGSELYGKTLSLLGLGKIGKEVAVRALAFGMHVLAYDPYVSEDYAKNIGVKLVSFEEALKNADYLSLHLPSNEQTKGLINQKTIDLMKDGVRIINCARGGIINEDDLVSALTSGKVAGAALDVFAQEPISPDNPLLKLENVILTPHLGASTEEAQERVAEEIANVVVDYFEKNIVRNAVNLPSIDPELWKILEPYTVLTRKMGSFLGQIIDGGIKEISLHYYGEIAQYNLTPLTYAFLQGFLSPILDIEVNLVNASFLTRERGIKTTELKTQEKEVFANLISVSVDGAEEKISFAGTLLSDNLPRLVRIGQLSIDVLPEGWLLVLNNVDRPGIIGYVGTVLGKNGINIASMEVGRKMLGGEAVTFINVDTEVPAKVLEEIRKYPGITRVKLVKL